MTKKSPRIAVLGCGYWGKNLVRNFAELGVLTAICDDNKQTAKELSKKYKIPIQSWETILSNDTIDGVVIATPAITHADLTIQALKAGKHVFV
ncbi:MAG: Gfo/Idh/MocA family oxidoreductase, partial [Pseudomonadota bacterium]